MKKALSLILATVMLLSLLVGCGATTGGNEETAQPEATASDRTDLNLSLAAAGTTMDPHNSGQQYDLQVEYQIYEGLLAINWETLELYPRIAESWEMSEDGMTYTFKIRQGVKFHNGDELTMNDILFTFNRAMEASQLSTYMGKVDSFEAADDSTFVIHMKAPFSAMLHYLNMIKIVSEKVVTEQGEQFGATEVDAGTGPYYLSYYDRNTKITLEKFDDYYGTPANIQTVNFYVITDASARMTALQTGELDFLNPNYADYLDMKAVGQFTCAEHESPNVRYLALNPANSDSPLYDKRVRQAVQYALDKQQIIDISVSGVGGIVADHMMKPGDILGANETSWKYERNVEKAKELLAEAGYANGCNIGTIQTASATYAVAAQVVQEQLKEVGITCDIVQGQTSTMLVDWRAGNFDCILNGINPVITYDSFLQYNNYTREAVFVKYDRNPETDEIKINDLFAKAAASTNEDDMNKYYTELEEYLMDASCYIPLWWNVNVYAWDKNLNAQTYTTYFNVAEWSWQ